MNDILARHRAAGAKHAQAATPDRTKDTQDRNDLTYAPDAKKARQIVRQLMADPVAGNNLAVIAKAIATVTGDQKNKHNIEEAIDNYVVANAEYYKEEGRNKHGDLIGWMGGMTGFGIALPPDAPKHKLDLREAWDALLQRVNDATKVGVQKKHREMPITLIADLEDTRLILPESYNPDSW